MSRIVDRRSFIGGSDARVIMGDDEPALLRLEHAQSSSHESTRQSVVREPNRIAAL